MISSIPSPNPESTSPPFAPGHVPLRCAPYSCRSPCIKDVSECAINVPVLSFNNPARWAIRVFCFNKSSCPRTPLLSQYLLLISSYNCRLVNYACCCIATSSNRLGTPSKSQKPPFMLYLLQTANVPPINNQPVSHVLSAAVTTPTFRHLCRRGSSPEKFILLHPTIYRVRLYGLYYGWCRRRCRRLPMMSHFCEEPIRRGITRVRNAMMAGAYKGIKTDRAS